MMSCVSCPAEGKFRSSSIRPGDSGLLWRDLGASCRRAGDRKIQTMEDRLREPATDALFTVSEVSPEKGGHGQLWGAQLNEFCSPGKVQGGPRYRYPLVVQCKAGACICRKCTQGGVLGEVWCGLALSRV